jgi:hypothetical protein
LVGCGKAKVDTPTPVPAKKLYTGGLFKSCFRFSTDRCDYTFIVSAKYGLLSPDEKILTYDMTLTDLRKGEIDAWAIEVVRELAARMRGVCYPFQAVILAGSTYADPIFRECSWNHIPACRPMRGMPQGKRLKWLAEQHRIAAKK